MPSEVSRETTRRDSSKGTIRVLVPLGVFEKVDEILRKAPHSRVGALVVFEKRRLEVPPGGRAILRVVRYYIDLFPSVPTF